VAGVTWDDGGLTGRHFALVGDSSEVQSQLYIYWTGVVLKMGDSLMLAACKKYSSVHVVGGKGKARKRTSHPSS